MKFNLPSPATLNNHLPVKFVNPGIYSEYLSKISNFAEKKLSVGERQAVLVFDGIHILYLTYHTGKDLVEGVPDDGNDRIKGLGSEVTTFLKRGLTSHWAFIVGHTISSGPMTGSDIQPFVLKIVEECSRNFIDIKVMVCDQGSSNRKLFSLTKVTLPKNNKHL